MNILTKWVILSWDLHTVWKDRKKIKIKKKLAVAHREYLLDSYFTSFVLVIITGPEGTCFILSFLRTEERFQTQDPRNCIGTEKGRMFEDGNSIEEGNLTSYLNMWCKHSVLDKFATSTQKTSVLHFEFCELVFSKNCEVVSILQDKPIRK